MRYWLWPVAVVLMVLLGFTVLTVVASRTGGETRRGLRECHARGADFHYWQERKRCVRYVDGR